MKYDLFILKLGLNILIWEISQCLLKVLNIKFSINTRVNSIRVWANVQSMGCGPNVGELALYDNLISNRTVVPKLFMGPIFQIGMISDLCLGEPTLIGLF